MGLISMQKLQAGKSRSKDRFLKAKKPVRAREDGATADFFQNLKKIGPR
jgi:hypothetical protein